MMGSNTTGDTGSTMRAAVLRSIGSPLMIEQIPVPQPGRGEVLIKVIACGVCHSDVHAVDGDWAVLPTLPLIPGHEITGTIVALGDAVDRYRVGEMVGVPWMYSSCGLCELCLAGMETICLAAESTGYSKPGGFAEYVVAPAAFIGRLPVGTDPFTMAPILCAGVTTYRALKRTAARPGQWVAIVGVGGLGHIAVQYASAMGLRVVGIDVSDDRLALASRLGAEIVVNSAAVDAISAIQDATGGVHAALVTATASAAFEQAVAMLRPAGTVCYIGMPGRESDLIRTSIAALIYGELTIRGSSVGTRSDLAEAIAFAASGHVTSTITVVDLADVNDALNDLRLGRTVGRTVLRL
jgi:alcohol dehydrogenase, propanol-preferring